MLYSIIFHLVLGFSSDSVGFLNKYFEWESQVYHDYQDSVLFDYEDGLVFYVRYSGGIPIDTYKISPLSHYLDSLWHAMLIKEYMKAVPETLRGKSASEGLIPTIDVPIRFPKALSFLGEGGKLDIRGGEDVIIGGQSTYMHNPSMGADTGSSFPTLNLESSMRVLLTGTVGSKLHITLDYDQKRENQNKNIVKLKYTGDEDEVVRSVEAGQTSFSIQGTQFASFAGGGGKTGLFGLKGIFNFGGVEVQAVLTRETGESSQGTFVGGAREDTLVLYGKDYLRNKFYYIDEPDSIKKIYVLVHDGSGVQGGEIYHCVAYFYDPLTQRFDSSLLEDTRFRLLEDQTDFIFYPTSKVLELKNPLDEGNILGVAYEKSNGEWVGTPMDSAHSVYMLRLIKPSRYMNNMDTLYTKTDTLKARLFTLEIKNIYPINFYGVSEYEGLSIEDISLTIYKDSLGSNTWKSAERGKTYLQLLGLDNDGDGKIDPTVNINGRIVQVFDGIRKYLIFPDPYPFMSDSLEDPDSIIYKKPELNFNEGKKYKLVFVRRAHIQRVINLGVMDIVEGSEVVKYNGRLLQRNRDYTIDYDMGTVTILDSTILNDPTAKIEINYEYTPFFQTKSRSLYGIRANYGSDAFRIGGTFLGRSEATEELRPKLGQEPVKNAILEGDFQIKKDLSFLARPLSFLTWGTQSIPPQIRIQGEVARSFPNLNTTGYGYIDDMDNSKKTGGIYLNYTQWKYGSRPVLPDESYAPLDLLCDTINWFTFTNIFAKRDIYDNLSEDEAREPATVLAVRVVPHGKDSSSWASISQLLDDRGNYWNDMEYLEVIVKGERGKIHIDLGSYISEDAVWRDKEGNIKGWHHDSLSVIDTEDRNKDGQWIAGEEDTGLDGVYGDDDKWSPGSRDDGNDDYASYNPSTGDWFHVNNTEHNGRFDTEELKVDGILDTTNDYFEYVIDLSDTTNPTLKSINKNGFRHYLIPLRDPAYYRKVGNPYFENIRVARLWFNGLTEKEVFFFAKLEVVGSRWQKIGIFALDSSHIDSSEEFGVRTVSVREEPQYTTPPGVQVERDPITGRLTTERSLGLSYAHLAPSHYALVRYYPEFTQSQNLLGYRTLSFFVKPSPSTNTPYPELEIRIGDTINFYIYRFPITSSDWQEIDIPLDSLTRYKMYVQDSLSGQISPDSLYTNGRFGFKGSPNLRAVRNYDILVINSTTMPLTGEIWIDEFRLKNPRNEHGTAYSLRGQIQFGGLLNISYNVTQRDETFKTLGQALNQFSANSSRSTGYQISFRPSLFLPPDWGINLSASYSGSRSLQLPRYKPNTDIILDREHKYKNKTRSVSERFSIQYSKQRSKSAILNILFDPFSFSYSSSKSNTHSPTTIMNNFSSAASLTYSYSPNFHFKLFGHTITPLPNRLSFGASYASGKSRTNDIFSGVERRDSNKTLSYNYSIGFRPFQSFGGQITRSMARDFYWDTINAYKFGKLSQTSQNFNLNYTVNVLGIMRPNISFNSSFTQRFDRNLRSDTLPDVSNINNSGTFTIQSTVDIRKVLRKILGEGNLKKSDSSLLSPSEYLVSQLRAISGYISSPNINYSIQQNSNYQYVYGDVDVKYIFGIEFEPEVKSLIENQRTWGKNNTFTVNESFSLPLGGLNLMYSKRESHTYNYTQEQVTNQETWPQLSFSLNRQFLKPIEGRGKYIENLSLSLSYSKKRQTQGIKGEPLRSIAKTITLNPQTSFRLLKRVSVNGGYSLSTQRDTSLIGTPQEMLSRRATLNFSASYSFRNPQGIKIPGVGRLKLKNEVTVTLSYTRNSTTQARTNLNTGESTPIAHNISYNMNLSASYNFSKDITGTLSFSRGGNEDVIHSIKTINTTVNVKASFRF